MPFFLLAMSWGILAGHYGLISTHHLSLSLPFFAAFTTALLGALALSKSPTLLKTVVSFVIFALLGLTAIEAHKPILPQSDSLSPFIHSPDTLYLGEVMLAPQIRRDGVRIPVRLYAAVFGDEVIPLEGGVLISLRTSESDGLPLHGEYILTRLTLKRFHNFGNPGGYDYVWEQASRGLQARAHLSNKGWIVRLENYNDLLPASDFTRALKSRVNLLRNGYLNFIQATLPGDTGALYAALLIGYRNLTTKETHEAVIATGVAHLLAISGLHLGLVAFSTFWLACRLLRYLFPALLARYADKHLALWVALAATLFYAAISGMALPTWRALVVVVLLFVGILCYRKEDFVSTLCAAAITILAIAPHSLRQPSFQLSFAAVTGIVSMSKVFSPLITRWAGLLPMAAGNHPWLRFMKPFRTAFWVSMAANLTVLPIIAYHFHGISLMGFLVNTILVPLVGMVALPIGLAACVIHAVSPFWGTIVLELGGIFLDLARRIIVWGAQWDWSYRHVGTVPLRWIVTYYLALIIALLPYSRIAKAVALPTLILCSALAGFLHSSFQARPPLTHLRATIIDVGQGSATLLEFPTGEVMLVDGGGFWDDSFDVGRYVLAPFLWSKNIGKLDYVVLSHDHPDHKNGLKFILSTFDVGELWESGINEKQKPVGDLEAIALKRGIPVRKLENVLGSHAFGEVEVAVIHPTLEYLEKSWDRRDINNVSIVLEVRYGQTSLLLPGDIDQSVESILPMDIHDRRKRLIVAAHHGSARSSGKEWLGTLQPKAVIISCGPDNVFGFPRQEVLDRCETLGIPVHRTDLAGAIEVLSDGQNWVIRETKAGLNEQTKAMGFTLDLPSGALRLPTLAFGS